MWIYTHFTLALRKRLPEEIPGENRAILELAVAMQDELDIKAIEPSILREQQLKERIKKEIQGGAISSTYFSSELESHSIRKGLVTWFKTDRWWLLAMLVTSTFASTAILWAMQEPSGLWVWSWSWSILFGQFWAFCIGTTVGSRLLIISFWSFVGGVIVIALAATFA
jgi:hypothetical protein